MGKVDISNLSYKELVDLMEQAEGEVENRKEQAIKELRAQFDQKLFEMGVSIRELYPELSGAADVKSSGGSKPKQALVPKYRNPEDHGETWTGRGRVIAWVSRVAEEKGISVDDIKKNPAYLNPDHPNYEAHKAELG